MTLTVLVRDPTDGALAALTVSHSLAVGARVAWIDSGTAVVATQSITEPRHGPAVLEQIRQGAEPGEAVERVLADDAHRSWRQVAALSSGGATACHDGELSFGERSCVTTENIVVLGNMLAHADTATVVAESLRNSRATLEDRLLTAMREGDAFGGDRRGLRSGALLVAREGGPSPALSVRVDDHSDPLAELDSLRASAVLQAQVGELYGDVLSGKDEVPTDRVREFLARAQRSSRAHATDVLFWGSVLLLRRGQVAEGNRHCAEAIDRNPAWRDFLVQLRDRKFIAEHRDGRAHPPFLSPSGDRRDAS